MCQVKQRVGFRIAEKLYNKPKRSIGHHIDEIARSMELVSENLRAQDCQQNQIQQDFSLTGRKAHAV